MAFSKTEQEIIKYGIENGKTSDQVKQAIINSRTHATGVPSSETNKSDEGKPDYLERVAEEGITAAQKIKKTTERGAELMNEGKPLQGAFLSGMGAAGGAIRGVFAPITAAVAPTIQKILEDSGILENEKVQETIQGFDNWAKENPDLATNVENVSEIVLTLTGTKGAKAITSGVKKQTSRAIDGIKTGIKTGIKDTKEATSNIKLGEGLQGAKDLAGSVVDDISRMPSKIKTNVATKQVEIAAIKELPSDVAKNAVRDGVDILDVKDIYSIPASIKPAAKELADNVVKFAKGETNIDPIEMVGKPIVARLKELESIKSSLGKQLGELSKKLGNVTSSELKSSVTEALQKALPGLKINSKGILNFAETTLMTDANKSARTEIQSIFTDAIKAGTGEQKHKLRQELFEILGGKKTSLANLTSTHEGAINAVRKGLADVLDVKNDTYKALNMEFAKTIAPVKDLRKAMKAIPGATEDILDMNAGLLARRITSTSMSQGQIEMILKAMDSATAVKGTLNETTKGLQDLYNVLGKYYDIAPKTGFQGQIKAGMESSNIFYIMDSIRNAVKSVVGKTTAVRQKAIEDAIADALK